MEIGRADSWSISTLIIKPEDGRAVDAGTFETFLSDLLSNLVEGNGHWDKGLFDAENRYVVEMAKHVTGQAVRRWAERVAEKIIS